MFRKARTSAYTAQLEVRPVALSMGVLSLFR